MKRYTVLFFVVISVVLLSSCFQQYNEDESFRLGWSLTREDNFNKMPEEAKWTKTLRSKPHMYRYMSDSELVYEINEGNIVLKGIVDPEGNPKLPFLTGGINTKAFKAGETTRIEVRARINPTSGVTPYIALVPNNTNDNIVIDIIEQYGGGKKYCNRYYRTIWYR